MKDHTRLFLIREERNTTVQQKRAISRRSVLLSLAGLVVASCAQAGGTSSLPVSRSSPTASAIPELSPTTAVSQIASSTTTTVRGKTLLIYKGHSGNVKTVGWSPDGAHIASAGYDGEVQIWDATSGKIAQVYRGHPSGVGALAWSPDGKYIVSGDGNTDQKGKNTAQVWKTDTGQRLITYTGHTNAITAIAWSPDGTRIISASWDGTVQIWDPLTGKTALTLAMKENSTAVPIAALAVSPDSLRVVAGVSSLLNGTDQRRVTIYQSQTGSEILTYHDTLRGAQALAWSPDGGSIAMSGGGSDIRIWNATSGEDTMSLQAINASVLALAWSPDGKHLASGGGSTQAVMTDNQAQVWDRTSKTVSMYRGHSAPVSSVSWSPDGTRIASASWDHTVQIWQAV